MDDWAQTAADEIIENLRDRRGLAHVFDEIDAEIQEEIRDTWAGIIRRVARTDGP
jgi:hypothetical protein